MKTMTKAAKWTLIPIRAISRLKQRESRAFGLRSLALAGLTIGLLSSCTLLDSKPTNEQITQLMKQSFAERGDAKLDRLDQSELQRFAAITRARKFQKQSRKSLSKPHLLQ